MAIAMSTESNAQDSNDVTKLLLRAGALACTRCGVQSLVPAHDSDGVMWFCFECGYHTSRFDAPLKNVESPIKL